MADSLKYISRPEEERLTSRQWKKRGKHNGGCCQIRVTVHLGGSTTPRLKTEGLTRELVSPVD
ncbi:MAG: hypothetical protein U9P10_08790 [Thermodesulfobacteriota bacterium]|nr:hypothetical protein [Thermodesulfobacteriota bacterium]